MQEIFELYKKYNITYNDAMDDMTKIVIKGMDNYNNNIDFIKKNYRKRSQWRSNFTPFDI